MMVKFIDFKIVKDVRGSLLVGEVSEHIPFNVKRSFLTCGVPLDGSRGGHAYKTQSEVIIPLSGSVQVEVLSEEHGSIKVIDLRRIDQGILLPPLTWRKLVNFSSNTVLLHLSDKCFDSTDYIFEINEL